MNDVLSTRLDAIETHLLRVKDFAGLDQKRLTNLERLAEILDGPEDSIRKHVRDVEDEIGWARNALEDFQGWIADYPDLSEYCNPVLQSLEQALNELGELRRHVKDAIDTATAGVRQRPSVRTSALSQMALNAFDRTAENIFRSLQEVRDSIAEAERAEGSGDQAGAVDLWTTAWKRYFDKVYTPSRDLFGDYVDFLLGLATRDSRLDEGICQLADELIKQWSSEVSLTIPAKQAALDSTLARIVRLGFQDWSIWALPLIAREVGYVVNSKDRTSERLARFLDQQVQSGHRETDLRDYLADVFATYVMGPAYCFAAIYLRFDPLRAYGSLGDHPPDAMRAEVIFDMLAWMSSRKTTDDSYRGILEQLRGEWGMVLAQAGQPVHLAPEVEQQLSVWVESLADIVFAERQVMFPVNSWRRAMELRDGFLQGTSTAQSTDDPRAVLNAAWLARVRAQAQQAGSIANLANDAFWSVVSRRSLGPASRAAAASSAAQRQPLKPIAPSLRPPR